MYAEHKLKVEFFIGVVFVGLVFITGFLTGSLMSITHEIDYSPNNTVDFQPNMTEKLVNKTEINNYEGQLKRPYSSIPKINAGDYRTELSAARCDDVREITGLSMRPALWSGNEMCLQEIDSEDVERGMLVWAESDEKGAFIHQVDVVYENNGDVILRGINNPDSYDYDKVHVDDIRYVVTQVRF